jgi:hypothetical protein
MRISFVRCAIAASMAVVATVLVQNTSVAQAPPVPPGIITCQPGTSGVVACPCTNPPSGLGRGCDNSLHTGGGALNATGMASLSSDNILFQAAFMGSTGASCSNPTTNVACVLYEGTLPNPTGAVWGDGVLCCGGSFYPLSIQLSNGGMMTFPVPGTTGVSMTAIALGDPLVVGSTRCYFVAYRDACPTFCTPSPRQKTNSYQLTWGP